MLSVTFDPETAEIRLLILTQLWRPLRCNHQSCDISSFCSFRVSLGHFVLVLLAFIVFDLVYSVLSQEIGWEERLQNDLFVSTDS